MIESITLENWKTHKNSTLHFRKGTNVLVGVIGSGKSSVMDGLCYGLFGTFPAVHSHRVSVSDLLMRKPISADQARVEVSFGVGEKKYRVERILKRDGINEGRLWCNGTLIAGPKPNQVSERVEKELNVTYELFTRAVYSEQNNVDYFLKLNPGERKKKMDELLELQKYEGVRANAMQVVNQFRKQEELHAQSLRQFDAVLQNQDLNEMRLNVSMQNQKIASLASRQEGLANAFANAKEHAALLEQEFAKANALKEKMQRLETQRESMVLRLEGIRKQFPLDVLRSREQLEDEKKDLSEKWAMIVQRQEQIRRAEAAVQKSTERVRGLDARLRELESVLQSRSMDEIESALQTATASLDLSRKAYELCLRDASSRMAKRQWIEHQLVSLEANQQSISLLHASCPTCRQAISDEHKAGISATYEAEKAKLGAEKQLAERSMNENDALRGKLEAEYAKLDSEMRAMARLQEKAMELAAIRLEREKAAVQLEADQAAIAGWGVSGSPEEVQSIQTRLNQLERVLEFVSLSEQVNKLEGEVVPLQDQLARLNVSQADVLRAVQARAEAQSAISGVEKELQLEKKMGDELQLRVRTAEQVVAQQRLMKEKRDRAADVHQSMGVFANVLVDTQQQLRETVVEAINVALLELWPWVYPYKDFTLAKVLVRDQDYVLTVQERNGNWVSAESSLSGGERSAAALALRMAIAFVLTRQLSWMILDEPTHNLDAKSVATLSEVLRTRLPELVDQVFVITHASEIEKAATGSLYVLQREKNEDGATIPVNKLDLGMRSG